MNNLKNIALCGFMGSGKSTVGACLAKKLNISFYDLDNCIEKKTGLTVFNIFKKYNEQYFRNLEHTVLKNILSNKNSVIALGGGTILFEKNLKLLKQYSKIVFLDVSLDEIILRLKDDNSRPLLLGGKNVIIKELYNLRISAYKSSSDITINGNLKKETVCTNIIKALQLT